MDRHALALQPEQERRPASRLHRLAEPSVDGAVSAEVLRACGLAMHRLGGSRLRGLGVTSSLPGEGRSTIAIAMANLQAREYGRSTLLLDTSFERPSVGRRFDLPPGPGLAQIVGGRASVEDALYYVGQDLAVMPAGEIGGPPSRLATEFLESGLLEELRSDFKVVIADLPALLESPYGALLAETFESPLLVVRSRSTPVSDMKRAASLIAPDPAVLLNGTHSRIPGRLRRYFS